MRLTPNKKIYLANFLLAALLASGQAVADRAPTHEMEKPMTAGYSAPCHIKTDGCWNGFIWGSFTYFQPIQENMELGVVSDSSSPLDLVNGSKAKLDFDYKPGFKVGFGANLPYDDWMTFVEYTWFRGTQTVQRNNDTQADLLPAWQIPDFLDPRYNFGLEKWTLDMDLVDWDLARGYHVGKHLCFLYSIGARYARIQQTLDVDYVNANAADFFIWPSTYIDQFTRSWGVGPKLSLTSDWNFCGGFRLIGKGAIDLLFTQYDLKSTQKSEVAIPNQYILKDKNMNTLRLHTELSLGLGFGRYFFSNSYHFDLSADYGFQVFFDQNMFQTSIGTQALGTSFLPNGNLYIHGLTVKARFDF